MVFKSPTWAEQCKIIGCGAFYVLLTLGSGFIYHTAFALPTLVDRAKLSDVVFLYQVAASLIIVPSLLILVVLLANSHAPSLADRLRSANPGAIFASIAIVTGASVMLNALGLWPYTWRSANNAAALHVSVLVAGKDWLGFTLFVFRVIIFIPLVEEVFFRFGLLYAVLHTTGSRTLAVVATSGIFAVLHLGSLSIPDPVLGANSFWLFVFSVAMGYLVLAIREGIWIAITAHVSRNAMELLTLLFAIHRAMAAT